jgi:tRNA(Ile)-lysidine synthase
MPQLPRNHYGLLERFVASLGEEARTASRLLIAVSGGADSMALLELTVLAREGLAAADVAAYVDHGLRPETSEEAAHVRAAAIRLGVGFDLVKLDPPGSDERSLREARYAALETLAASREADFVLTGHTRDDQIETVLHRLVRGAGRLGIAGIPQRRDHVVRPLLAVGRDELRRFLRERRSSWREDPSNSDLRYLRNRVRHRIIPAIEAELGPGALDHLPALATEWREEEAYLAGEAARYAEFTMVGPTAARRLDASSLNAAPAVLRSRIVRAWLAERTGRPATTFSRAESAAVLALAEKVGGSRRIALEHATVINVYGELDLTAGERTTPNDPPPFGFELATCSDARVTGPGGWVFEIANFGPGHDRPSPARAIAAGVEQGDFDREHLGGIVIVRSGRPGDRLRATALGHRKVADLMIDARIPQDQRSSWPIVEAGGRVVWVPGLARSEDFAPATEQRVRVRLTWRRELA